MGISQLWSALREHPPADATLLELAGDSLISPSSKLKGLRVGIDAEIWIIAIESIVLGKLEGIDIGANAVVRTVFFKLLKLMREGALPFLMFDGRNKPSEKRGQPVSGSSVGRATLKQIRGLCAALGVPYRIAKGEAEAELAFLCKAGHLDIVMTDDSDIFVFGCPLMITIRTYPTNSAASQTSRKSSSQSTTTNMPRVYSLKETLEHMKLDQDAFLFIALVSGGDYDKGISGMGMKFTLGLASLGFGSQLRIGYEKYSKSPDRWARFTQLWRDDICDALRTNRQGKIGSKRPSVANEFAKAISFPDLRIYNYYFSPSVNVLEAPDFGGQPNIPLLAAFCAEFFEFQRIQTLAQLRTSLWPALVIQLIRKSIVDIERNAPAGEIRKNESRFKAMVNPIKSMKKEEGAKLWRIELNEYFFKEELEPHLIDPPDSTSNKNLNFDENGESSSKPRDYRELGTTTDLRHWFHNSFLQFPTGLELIQEFEMSSQKKLDDAASSQIRIAENKEKRLIEKERKLKEKERKQLGKVQSSPQKKLSFSSTKPSKKLVEPILKKKNKVVVYEEVESEIEDSDNDIPPASRPIAPSLSPPPKKRAPRRKSLNLVPPPLQLELDSNLPSTSSTSQKRRVTSPDPPSSLPGYFNSTNQILKSPSKKNKVEEKQMKDTKFVVISSDDEAPLPRLLVYESKKGKEKKFEEIILSDSE